MKQIQICVNGNICMGYTAVDNGIETLLTKSMYNAISKENSAQTTEALPKITYYSMTENDNYYIEPLLSHTYCKERLEQFAYYYKLGLAGMDYLKNTMLQATKEYTCALDSELQLEYIRKFEELHYSEVVELAICLEYYAGNKNLQDARDFVEEFHYMTKCVDFIDYLEEVNVRLDFASIELFAEAYAYISPSILISLKRLTSLTFEDLRDISCVKFTDSSTFNLSHFYYYHDKKSYADILHSMSGFCCEYLAYENAQARISHIEKVCKRG